MIPDNNRMNVQNSEAMELMVSSPSANHRLESVREKNCWLRGENSPANLVFVSSAFQSCREQNVREKPNQREEPWRLLRAWRKKLFERKEEGSRSGRCYFPSTLLDSITP